MNDLRPGTVDLDGASLTIGYCGLISPQHRGMLRELTSVWVEPGNRHQGRATALMAEVCRIADADRVTLMVRPDPYGHRQDTGLSARALAVWYAKRFGFFTLQSDPLVMIRLPDEVQPTQALPLSPMAQAARVVALEASRRPRAIDNDRGPDGAV